MAFAEFQWNLLNRYEATPMDIRSYKRRRLVGRPDDKLNGTTIDSQATINDVCKPHQRLAEHFINAASVDNPDFVTRRRDRGGKVFTAVNIEHVVQRLAFKSIAITEPLCHRFGNRPDMGCPL